MSYNFSGSASGALSGASAGSTLGPWGTAGGAIIGGLLGGFSGSSYESGQNQTNAFNALEAQKNRDFQERMYKNRHTYEVEDLLRAGLNPVLSAKYGGGSVPTGAQATFNNPKLKDHEAKLANARSVKEIALLGSAIKKNMADADKASSEAMRARGSVVIPGIGNVPVEIAQSMYKDYQKGRTNANDNKGSSSIWSDIQRLGQSTYNRSPAIRYLESKFN